MMLGMVHAYLCAMVLTIVCIQVLMRLVVRLPSSREGSVTKSSRAASNHLEPHEFQVLGYVYVYVYVYLYVTTSNPPSATPSNSYSLLSPPPPFPHRPPSPPPSPPSISLPLKAVCMIYGPTITPSRLNDVATIDCLSIIISAAIITTCWPHAYATSLQQIKVGL